MFTEAKEIQSERPTGAKPCEDDPFYRASSTLLSRLAEAVDGHRTGGPVCYVGRYFYNPSDNGHRLFGPFRTCKDAARFRDENKLSPGEYGVFGPFYTKEAPARRRLNGSMVPKVTHVIVYLQGGDTITLNGDEYDTVFWTQSAVEKFVFPYYVAIGSLDECVTLKNRVGDSDVWGHRPGSQWDGLQPDPNLVGVPVSERPDVGIGLYALTADEKRPLKVATKLLSGASDR